MAYLEASMTADDDSDEEFPDAPAWEYADRKRGIFTESDRELLFGWRELEGQELRNARYRTRQRVVQSLNDLVVLSLHLDASELGKILADETAPIRYTLFSSLIRIAYQTVELDDEVDDEVETFEQELQQTLYHYYNDDIDREEHPNQRFEVDVDVEVEEVNVDLNELERQIRRGEATPAEAMKYLETAAGQDDRRATGAAKDIIAEEIFGEDYDSDA